MNKRNAPNPHCLLSLLLRRRAVGAEEGLRKTARLKKLACYVLFVNALRIQSIFFANHAIKDKTQKHDREKVSTRVKQTNTGDEDGDTIIEDSPHTKWI